MKTVKEVSKISGVSVRTLHHYDEIGLFKPTEVTSAGYRLYDDKALCKLQMILMFRELRFPLKEIKRIVESQNFNRREAILEQIKLLELQRKHLDELIYFAHEILRTGVNNMDFSAFDKKEIEEYALEVKQRWGETDAFREYENRFKDISDTASNDVHLGLIQLFKEAGCIKNLPVDSGEAQKMVEKIRGFINDNYYTCTMEILAGLGQMYIGDERFKKNIDEWGGDGTAEFVSRAIEVYCK